MKKEIRRSYCSPLSRPDNNAVMELIKPLLEVAGLQLSYRDKVACHAFFNSLVLIIAMINVSFQAFYPDQ